MNRASRDPAPPCGAVIGQESTRILEGQVKPLRVKSEMRGGVYFKIIIFRFILL